MRSPFRLLTCLGALALATAPAWVIADPLSAEDRLEAIRQSLVQHAMQGPTEVRSAAFIDGTGALREASSFVTGMEIRGIRVIAYGRDMDDVKADSKKALPLGGCPAADKSGAWHHISWQVAYSAHMPVAYQFEAQQIALQFKQQAFRRAQASALWRLVEPKSVADGYEQVLVGQGEKNIPWQLKLTIAPSMAAGLPRTSAYDVRWELQSKWNGATVFAAEQKINIDQPRLVPTSSRPLGPVVLAQIQAALAGFSQGMERELSCRVPQFEVVKVRTDLVRIAGGAASGLKVGARMVLTDKSKLPSRALEPKALDSLAMAEVVSVSDYYAELKMKTAGKIPDPASWIAIPYMP
jgi:hypothetical protein